MHDEESYRRRRRVVGFIVQSTHELQVPPIVKYSALCLFTDRFYSSISRKGLDKVHWLLDPISESNLQLFALASIWISSKIHSSPPLSFKTLKSLGDKSISEQHFTTRDFLDAVS
ncbi:unnamed protein product [Cuscuta epithymum]|uniref:Cyclin N-terminal domain-containing protein n=1 Tax=Cuscuta epithymum TaxID=186058 RepID=A0AAV0GER0_9ASTE|nr:unnamed protein product [Cuscuta epithymum]CAH9146466.1 unnamed protein product [Cuscuta epithymum]